MKILNKDISLKKGVSLPSGSVRFSQLIDIALKNLFYKRLRTILTISGVMIGVGAVLFLLAFGFGLRNVVQDQVVDSNSIRTIDISTIKSELVQLDNDTIESISGMQGAESTARLYNEAGTTKFRGSSLETVLYGADQQYLNLLNYKTVAGRPATFQKPTDIFVNTAYVQAIGISDPNAIIGQSISIDFRLKKLTKSEKLADLPQSYTGKVQAVLDTGSGAEMYIASSVFTDAGADYASQLKVLADRKDSVPELRKKIEALGLVTTSPLETLDQINQIFAFLNILFLGFGSIGLTIAILGMFNTLTISLLERTKEIGLMITLGARRKDIRRLFMVEAVGLSLLGGLAGSIGAFTLSRIIDYVLNNLARSRGVSGSFTVFSFSAPLLIGTISFSILLGMIVVYLPAKRAANTNPIEALKN